MCMVCDFFVIVRIFCVFLTLINAKELPKAIGSGVTYEKFSRIGNEVTSENPFLVGVL